MELKKIKGIRLTEFVPIRGLRQLALHLVTFFFFFFCGGLVILMQKECLKFAEKGSIREVFSNGTDEGHFPVIDSNRKQARMWPNDPNCSSYVTSFSKDLEPTYLVSFPRSGNSWVRYMVEAATGIFSGSVYADINIKAMGFHGELESHTSRATIVIKTHTQVFPDTPPVPLQGKSRVILLIRNPAHVIPSYFSFKRARRKENPHFFNVEGKQLKSIGFRNFFKDTLPKWSEVTEQILVWTRNLLVVFYEEVVKDPISEVRRILQFLAVPEDPERIHCLANHIKGPAKRNHEEVDPDPEKRMVAQFLSRTVGLLQLRGLKAPDEYQKWLPSR